MKNYSLKHALYEKKPAYRDILNFKTIESDAKSWYDGRSLNEI